MTKTSAFIDRYAVLIFALLTISVSFASYLLPLPREVLPFIIVCIPTVLAVAMAAITDGLAGVHSLLRKLARWRVGLRCFLAALIVAASMRLAISLLALSLGWLPSITFRSNTPVSLLMLAVIFLVAAIPEELGWRGYALPRLLENRSPLFASLVIGMFWGWVHLVLHLPGMPSEGLAVLPTLFQLFGLSVLLTWFYIHGGQNIILTSIFHAAQSFFVIFNGGVGLQQEHWLMAVVWVGAGAIVILVNRSMQQNPNPVEA